MTNEYGVVAGAGQAPASADPTRSLRQWWTVITMLLTAAVFIEAVLAGAMLSGADWALKAHATSALMLAASTVIAGLAALATLRGVAGGVRLGWMLLSMAALVVLQAALGALAAKGVNLLWLHVPLGVALVGFAGQTVAAARRLGQRPAAEPPSRARP